MIKMTEPCQHLSNKSILHQGIIDMNQDSDTRSNTLNVECVVRHCSTRKRDRRKKEYWKLPFMRIFHVYIFLSCFLFFGYSISGFVIAPPWANPEVNRCSKISWQLIYWPQDDRCYQIFEQGPCPRSQELGFNEITGEAECRCPKTLLYWPAADRCYEEHSRGPCEVNQYLVSETSEIIENTVNNRIENITFTRTITNEKFPTNKSVMCKNTKICANGWIFWPPMQECFQLYTQGPCHKGDLLIMNALTAEPYCGCDPLLLRQYYFPTLRLCYEHHTRGPCESGLLFAYNHTADLTHCLCSESLANFHLDSQQCFQFGTKGPCRKGQVYQPNSESGFGECHCRDNYVSWHSNGECYKTYTPGPCRPDQFIVPSSHSQAKGKGLCVRNPCPRAHLFFPGGGLMKPSASQRSYKGLVRRSGGLLHENVSLDEEGDSRCYKVGSRGPCPLGQLVVFERYSGKSFKGECGCSEGYNQNYWPETGQCFEWYSQGPCLESFLFVYNRKEGRTECICDEQDGYVFWNETGRCYRVYSQGPCPNNAWLIPSDDLSEVFCECRTGYLFSSEDYACILKSSIVKQLETKILPYLRNHGKHIHPNHSEAHNRNDNEKYNSEVAEKIRKNAWTNLPELLRQIALANAQKQQQGRGKAKNGYLRPVNENRRDFVPSILESDDFQEQLDRGTLTRLPGLITSPITHAHGNLGIRSQPKSLISNSSDKNDNQQHTSTNDNEKHLLYHNMQLKSGGIKWTRGIFVKPGSNLPNEHNRYNKPSNTSPFDNDNYNREVASKDKGTLHRKSSFKTTNLPKSNSPGSLDIFIRRNDSDNHSSTRLNNYKTNIGDHFTLLNGYNRQRHRPRRRNKYTQSLLHEIASDEGTDDSMQLGTTAPGNRKYFPKRQSNPLDVSERRIDDVIIKNAQGLPRRGKQSSFEKEITDSVATLSSEGLSNSKRLQQNQWNMQDRQHQLHKEWWQTFQQRSGTTSRSPQRRRSRSLILEKSTREN